MRDWPDQTVTMAEVKEGDFIPGLDNAYVYEDAAPLNYWDDDTIAIHFHTAEGEEGAIEAPANMPLTIRRSPE